VKKTPRGDAPTKKKEPDASFRPFVALRALKQELEARAPKPADAKPPAPKRPSKAPPPPEGEDEALALYRMMNGVTPLGGKAVKRVPKSQSALARSELEARRRQAEAPQRAEDDAVHAHLRALVEGGRFEVSDDGRRVEGRRHGVTPDVARKLRRGMFPIDARLDLHGETAASAAKALEAFLKRERARGERCVLVIHGKGDHSPRGVGILRGEIAAWLSQGGGSPHVAAFATATEADGGEGAVYVLLTR
jgi:DNA-nicking Smr family endonuclease